MTFNLNISEFKTPDFTAKERTGWYLLADNDKTASMCMVSGIGLLSAFQTVLRDALRPPWMGLSTIVHLERVAVDGYVGPEVVSGAWAYLRLRGAPDNHPVRQRLLQMIESHKVTPELALIAIMSAYYWPRMVTPDDGNDRTLAPKIARKSIPDKALFRSDVLKGIESEGVFVASNAKLWDWNIKYPDSAKASELAREMPVCKVVIPTTGSAAHTTTRTTAPTVPVPPPTPVAVSNSGSRTGMVLTVAALAASAMYIFGGKQ